VQETLLRAWRSFGNFEGRASLRTWLYRIATNTCLRALENRGRRPLPSGLGAPGEDAHDPAAAGQGELRWLEPIPDALMRADSADPAAIAVSRASLRLALIAALQYLPARQRAVLILRDVLGFSAREVAATLDATPAAVDTALQRARRNADERLPERSQQATMRALGDRRLREIVDRFVAAWERADVEAVVGLLTEQAVVSMPPVPSWFRGRDAVATFLAARPLAGRTPVRLLATGANGQPAFAQYRRPAGGDAFLPVDLFVLTLEGERIAEITAFLDDEMFARFGLPARLAP